MNLAIKSVVAAAALLLSAVSAAETLSGKVVGVSDGDTIKLLVGGNKEVRVRLAGIDAPEKAQDFGQVSKKSLSDMVFGRQVSVEVQDTDRYGRTVGWVSIDGGDVNAAQVQRGMAWVYRQYVDASSRYGQALLDLEANAKTRRAGVWGGNSPIPPWEFRRTARQGE